MTQGILPSPGTPGWQVLARGAEKSDSITRCPGGHIHLDYDNLTLRFSPDEFLLFANMVAEAAAHLKGVAPPKPATLDHNPSSTFSVN